ncbi:diguanylate cyclase domain-containing protein [Pseudomonas turukhanskensis]|uniref:diguanylate cyclase domain-containing protein n=1 Tax=Pseudomonas turukhanskensis TaxID=1806536 RepID=UPI0022F32708|nr:diguanylate cyclase [Pseudomonas turukhanskensis]
MNERTHEARIALALLEQELLTTQQHLKHRNQTEQLREANANLMVAALSARTDAEQASRELFELAQTAQLDVLTGLPNRSLFAERIVQAIASAKRRAGGLALLFLDLNEFKLINDTLGHSVGDEALIQTAHCLTGAVREVDTVARYGGDEFLVLLADISQRSDALLVAEKIIDAMATPCIIGNNVLRLTGSIGISLYPDDGEDPQALIDCADAAMYRAKDHGGATAPPAAAEGDDGNAEAASRPQALLGHYDNALAEHERLGRQQREANEQLVLAVLNAQQLQSAAEHAHRQQNNLLAMVAHELRNPLAPLAMTAGLLGRVKAEELPRMQQIIERQVMHISRLIDDLLDVSRANTGKMRLDRERMDMADTINEAVDAVRSLIDKRQQQFHFSMPPGPLRVNGDGVRLAQIMSNLLSNASKYTPDGGAIRLVVSASESVLTLTVSDDGIGITPSALPHIFDPFIQDTHAIGFNGAGLGIGLTVVRELLTGHGGTVSASSPGPGEGSVFTVTLPLIGD